MLTYSKSSARAIGLPSAGQERSAHAIAVAPAAMTKAASHLRAGCLAGICVGKRKRREDLPRRRLIAQ